MFIGFTKHAMKLGEALHSQSSELKRSLNGKRITTAYGLFVTEIYAILFIRHAFD
jgi:hypothetical protein